MLVYFDESNDFNKDLEKLLANLDKYSKPLVVLPTDRDVKVAKNKYADKMDHVTFISYDYWLSKRWLVDANYDHIDYFRVDQFLMSRAFNTPVGAATVKRTRKKREDVKEAI